MEKNANDKKIALVTGGNTGIGFELCRQLARAGMKVVLTARDSEKGTAAAEKLKTEGADIVFHQLDISDPESISACASFIEKEFGKLDILMNNAGISGSSRGMISAPLEEIGRVQNTNYYGPLRVTRALFPFLKNSNDARVINISSKMGCFSELYGDYAAYRLSKAGLNAATVMFANEFKDHGIKVNAVHPGWVKTKMGGPNARRTPEEGADTAIWLATKESIPTGKFFYNREIISW